jgi:phosphatidylserine/phosphatidylglycerophosphate/cardiolipin synthase-like enzyme
LLNSHVLLLQSYEISDPDILKMFKNAVDSGTNLRILTESSRPYQWTNAIKELKTYFLGTLAQIRSDEHLSTQYLHDNFIITSSGFWIQTADLSTN